MIISINILLFLIIIKLTSEQPLFGECANVGYNAVNFESCKGKAPYDNNKYCCFLKAGKFKECVEILKKDVDDDAISMTIKEIERGIYEDWEDNNGNNLNRYYDVINSLECDKVSNLNLNYFSFFNFFILII